MDALRALELCYERGAPPRVTQLSADGLKGAAAFLSKELGRWLGPAGAGDTEVPIDLTVPNVAAGLRGLLAERMQGTGITPKLHTVAVKWLIEARAPGEDGGWGMYKSADPELLPTYHAVWALDLLRQKHPPEKRSAELLERCIEGGRSYFRKIAIKASGDGEVQCAWKQTAECPDVSPAATALAVLSLSHGSEGDRQLAQQGALWLIENSRRWCRTGEHAYEVVLPAEEGRFPNVALCALAIARSPAFPAIPEAHLVIGNALEHIESMWKPDLGGFAHEGYSPYIGMTRTILSLDRAIDRKEYDWARLSEQSRQQREPAVGEKLSGWRASMLDGILNVFDESEGQGTYVEVGVIPQQIVRHLQRAGDFSTIEALVKEVGGTEERVVRAIRRLNSELKDKLQSLPDGAEAIELDALVKMERRRRGSEQKRIWLRCDVTLSG